MGEYLTRDERLRRIGDLLLKGVYLWAEATQDGDTTGSGGLERCPSGPDLLEDFAARFDDLFRTVAQRRGFRTYLRGLLSPRERSKTLAALASTTPAATKSSASMQRLQYFLCESAWDTEAVAARRLALLRADSATCPHGAGVLVLEAGVDAWEGDGAAPAPVCSLWADERVCYPLHFRPLPPAGRLSGPADRPAADDRTDAVVALVEAAYAAGIAFRAVVGECAPGDRARIEEALRAISVPYVLAHSPAGGQTALSDTASRSAGNGQVCCRSPAEAAGKWVPVVRCFEDGHEETWWATERHARQDGLEDAARAVTVTDDPMALPVAGTWHLTTNLPWPDSPHVGAASLSPAALPDVLRLYGLHRWAAQSYRHVTRELGWEDVMVRSPRALWRHWELVCCVLAFCWETWLAQQAVGAGETPPEGGQDDPMALLLRRLLPGACRPTSVSPAAPRDVPARTGRPRPPAGLPPRVVDHRPAEGRIEEGRGVPIPDRHLGRKLAVRRSPAGWRRQRSGQRMGVTRVERGAERAPQAAGLEGEQGRDEDQVDEAPGTGGGMAAGVAAGVGMDLLDHVLLERERRDLDGRDLREAGEIGAAQPLRLHGPWIAETDVDGEVLEAAARRRYNETW